MEAASSLWQCSPHVVEVFVKRVSRYEGVRDSDFSARANGQKIWRFGRGGGCPLRVRSVSRVVNLTAPSYSEQQIDSNAEWSTQQQILNEALKWKVEGEP